MWRTLIGVVILVVGFMTLSGCSSLQSTAEHARFGKSQLQLGVAYLNAKNYPLARQKLMQALKLMPHRAVVWSTLGYYYAQVGDLTRAREYYLKAVQLEPTSGLAQNNYGVFLCRQGQYQAAIKHFNLAVADPNYLAVTQAYQNAAHCALKIPDKKLAQYYITKVQAYNRLSRQRRARV